MRTTLNRSVRSRRAFTLMEMLVVVAIIVMLAGLGGYYYIRQLDKAKKDAASTQIKTLTTACESYYTQHNSTWPSSLADLLQEDEAGGPYLKTQDAIIDPWGRPYGYSPPSGGQRQPYIWADSPAGRIGNGPGGR